MRTHFLKDINESLIGRDVTLCGWVDVRRDHGPLIFIDLRDRDGIVQMMFQQGPDGRFSGPVDSLRPQTVMSVTGRVQRRPKGTENPKRASGQVEIHVQSFEILNPSATPPFEIRDDIAINEEIRLKYRYLDLRRPFMQRILRQRHELIWAIRQFLHQEGFIEVETPVLTKSTPEGARDYLVPARLAPGKFYALPQSPQLFKQLLMVAGMDRYFQIARCFRDEDLRKDRQPEHTQLDMELSFIDEPQIFALIERLIAHLGAQVFGRDVTCPFPRLAYDQAMDRYASDKPDTRFELDVRDATDFFKGAGLRIFQEVLSSGGRVRGFVVSRQASVSDSLLDQWTAVAKSCGLPGLLFFRLREDGVKSPLAKSLSTDQIQALCRQLAAGAGDLILLMAAKPAPLSAALAGLREQVGRDLKLADGPAWNFLWVTDFPLFEYSEEEKRWVSMHHPFTSPRPEDRAHLSSDPGRVRARAYDLVLNGVEVGGGSIRIHDAALQQEIFRRLEIDEPSAREKFGFLLDAFQYGAPPHGGIALGLDRLLTMLMGLESIRDVIAFPKTQKGTCLMTDAPSAVSAKQLKELGLKIQ